MSETSSDIDYSSKHQLFTTRYTYGSRDQEFVFSCRGRPFAALVSPNFPTPTSSLFDYDLVKSLNLKLTDLQCRKFSFAGNKFRILGRISTTGQCVQNGRSGPNFHLKGLVISDLNKVLDTHCIAGSRMQQQLADLCHDAEELSDDDDLDEDPAHLDAVGEVVNERKCETESRIGTKSAKRKSESKFQNNNKKLDIRNAEEAAVQGLCDGVCQRHHVLQGDPSEACSHPAAGPQTGRRCRPQTQAEAPGPQTGRRQHPLPPADAKGTTSAPVVKSSSTFRPTTPTTAIPFDLSAIRTAIPPGICPKSHSSLYAIGGCGGRLLQDDAYDAALEYWGKYAEEKPFKLNDIDGKPRILNLVRGCHEDSSDMLRLGDWYNLDDPKSHQARHVLLALIRREAPDRACGICAYNLVNNHQHNCSLLIKDSVSKHCDECCQKLKSYYGAEEKHN